MSNRREWSYHAGRVHRNRVTVYRIAGRNHVMMEWREDGERIVRSLGHNNLTQAVAQAIERAAELHKKKPTHQPPDVLMAMRADLVRVAHKQGMPAGTAPGWEFYEQHGRWSTDMIAAAFKGWRGRLPIETWTKAIGRFKLRARYLNRSASHADAMADVRRVAHVLGNPRRMPTISEYNRHGRWFDAHVRKVTGFYEWDRLADALGLEMEWWRREAADRNRVTLEQKKSAA